jgi:hypothetical protein
VIDGRLTYADVKREATLKAEVALWGGVLHRIEGDDGAPLWIVSRWAMTRAFTCLEDVSAFVSRVTGTRLD